MPDSSLTVNSDMGFCRILKIKAFDRVLEKAVARAEILFGEVPELRNAWLSPELESYPEEFLDEIILSIIKESEESKVYISDPKIRDDLFTRACRRKKEKESLFA